MSQEEKDKIKEYQKKRYQELVQYKKEALKNDFLLFLSVRKRNEKTLKFENIRVNKKEFHKSKQPVDLASVNVDQIVYLANLNIVMKALSILLVIKR